MGGIPGRLVVIREGIGEAGSIENLVSRLGQDIGVVPATFQSIPRSPRFVITSPEKAVRAARIAATLQPAAALLTADLEDVCPAEAAPVFADAIRAESFSFPVALVFFYREFETLAISIGPALAGHELKSLGGQPIMTLQTPSQVPADPESPRDAKGWVSRELMGGSSYKPSIHQLPLTRGMRVADLRDAGLSSFRRLESALQFLADQVVAGTSDVYPDSAMGRLQV